MTDSDKHDCRRTGTETKWWTKSICAQVLEGLLIASSDFRKARCMRFYMANKGRSNHLGQEENIVQNGLVVGQQAIQLVQYDYHHASM